MTKIAIITSTTRPGRHSHEVAEWVKKFADQRTEATFEVVDIADYDLGNYDEAIPPSFGQYQQEGTKKWAAKIAEFDGFIFVTAEYNHSLPGALKNAIDFIYAEWTNKAAGIVSYGSAGGVRAAEHLRGILGELQIADVRSNVALSLFTDFENFTTFKPTDAHYPALGLLLDQVIGWSGALKTYREQLAAK